MNTVKRFCLAICTFLALQLSAQEAPIQKEYVAPETENTEGAKKTNIAVGASAVIIAIIVFAARRRKKRRQNLRK